MVTRPVMTERERPVQESKFSENCCSGISYKPNALRVIQRTVSKNCSMSVADCVPSYVSQIPKLLPVFQQDIPSVLNSRRYEILISKV